MEESDGRALPAGVEQHVQILIGALARASDGAPTEEVIDDLDRAFEAAFDAALTAGAEKRRHGPQAMHQLTDFGQIIAERLRSRRDESGWTQTQLADAMTRLGFPWKRITVAEVERGARKVSLEELTGLAALYGEPVFYLMLPGEGDGVLFPEGRALDPRDVAVLFIGDGGRIGQGGAQWGEPARIARIREPGTETDWRPARALWARRAKGYGQGLRQRDVNESP